MFFLLESTPGAVPEVVVYQVSEGAAPVCLCSFLGRSVFAADINANGLSLADSAPGTCCPMKNTTHPAQSQRRKHLNVRFACSGRELIVHQLVPKR